MKYWLEFNRITKKYERQFVPKINKALKLQVQDYIDSGNIEAVNYVDIYNVLKDMYNTVGVSWAFQSGRYVRAKKARKPLGFTERMIQMLQDQYTAELLNMSQNISETTKADIRKTLQEAALQGWSMQEITRRLTSSTMTEMRARLISRTEVIGAANAGAMLNAQDLGATTKIWIASIDARTRKDHVKLDGQRRAFNEPFSVVDINGITRTMMQPGDKNGGPGQVCNCRCAVGFE